MAKDKEKTLAYELYVKQHQTAKEIARRLGVSERTIGVWVNREGWKKTRNAQLTSVKSQKERIAEILNEYAEQTLYYIKQNKELSAKIQEAMANGHTKALKTYNDELKDNQAELARIDDGASKWRKQLVSLDKENRISLSIYIEVMERIFGGLRAFDQSLYHKTLDFQETHLQNVSQQL